MAGIAYAFAETGGSVAYPTEGHLPLATHRGAQIIADGALTETGTVASRATPNLWAWPITPSASWDGFTVGIDVLLPSSAAQERGLLEFGSGGDLLPGYEWLEAYVTTSNLLRVYVRGQWIEYNIASLRGDWISVAITWNKTTIRLYVNGGQVATAAYSGTIPDTSSMWVGCFEFGSYGHTVKNLRVQPGAADISTITSWLTTPVEPASPPTLLGGGRDIVLAARIGGEDPLLQRAPVISADEADERSWTATASEPWVTLSDTTGTTPGSTSIGADIDGLAAGVHQATVTFTDDGSSDTVTVPVSLVLNDDTPVSVTTWKNGHAGAFSLSTDDGAVSGAPEAVTAGYRGTFALNSNFSVGVTPEHGTLYQAGHELGPHTYTHFCEYHDRAQLLREIGGNLNDILNATGNNFNDIISLVWPCGFYPSEEYSVVATEYMLSSRGYNHNALEDPTPWDISDMKSYNSREHAADAVNPQPADMKTIVTAAESSGKWANLVLHSFTNDDGAIEFAATRDIWCAPIGDVVKYFMQRDRTVIGSYSETETGLTFSIRRLSMPTALRRGSFESTVKPTDTVTLRVDVGEMEVETVVLGTTPVDFDVRTEGGDRFVYADVPVTTVATEVLVSSEPYVPPVEPEEPGAAGNWYQKQAGQLVQITPYLKSGGSLIPLH